MNLPADKFSRHTVVAGLASASLVGTALVSRAEAKSAHAFLVWRSSTNTSAALSEQHNVVEGEKLVNHLEDARGGSAGLTADGAL